MKYFFGSLIALIVLLVGFVVWSSVYGPTPAAPRAPMGEKMPDQGGPHVARGQSHPAYNSNPPTSGWHWANAVAGPGVKKEQIPDELILHSMEHGAAVVWYKADLPQEQVDTIRSAYDAARVAKKIMAPRAGLDVPVALASWRYLLKLGTISTTTITEFILSNNDHGPEKAPI